MTRSAAARFGLVTLIVASCVVMRPSGEAGACSCAVESRGVSDQIGDADIAFVGVLVSTTTLEPPERDGPFGPSDLRYELRVEHAVKGVAEGDTVVMFGSTSETSCGTSELDQTQLRHAVLSWSSSGGRFVADSTPPCSRPPTVAELMAADLTLPLVESEWITRDSPASVGDSESSGAADVTTAPIGGSSADVPAGESPPAEFTTAESDDAGWSTTWWVLAVGLVLGGVGALAIATEGRQRTRRH